jgi:fructoselysine-6-P-deglycase FrlB-like protein
MRQEILEIPRALRMMWEKGRPQYDALVRRAAWSERPVFIIGSGSCYFAALTGGYAFESLLKLPVVVKTPEAFCAYTCSTLALRSLLIAVSASGECEKTLEAAQEAKKHGAMIWGLTANRASGLGTLADGVAPLYLHEGPVDGMQSALCQHAATLFLALAAARILGRPGALEAQEAELERLPEDIERIHNQFTDAARALAGEIRNLPRVVLTGGGLYHPVALQAAHHLGRLAGLPAVGFELLQFRDAGFSLIEKDSGVVVLSGSRGALKAEVHRMGRDTGKRASGRFFAITDSSDQPLSDSATMSVLLPAMREPTGALLALAFLNCVTHYAAGHTTKSARRAHR